MATAKHNMASGTSHIPPQHNLQDATQLALMNLSDQSEEQLLWLGVADAVGGRWRLPVLDSQLEVDIFGGVVRIQDGVEVKPQWRILLLHYLCGRARPTKLAPEVAFADLSSTRTYASVYDKRVIGRLCGTVGRNAETLRRGAGRLGATFVEAGDVAFDLLPFPRLPVRVIWYGPDEEFPASATLLFPASVESLLPAEDIVVLAERLVSRLDGGSF